MVDDLRSVKDALLKLIAGRITTTASEDEDSAEDKIEGGDAGAARALIGALFAKAGKGKDEIVQIVAREMGAAVAAMLKEPLTMLAKHQKLQISFEFVPKDDERQSGGGDQPLRKRRASKRRRRFLAPGTPKPKRSQRSRKADNSAGD